ncbi:MAG TPA: CBS and ACT domain-containing protein [Rhodothermales bacterium]|nr:CBS and ACT domain-containing protein [Rhodothermales bacterium]
MLVRDIMHGPAVTISVDTSLADAYHAMQHHDVRHLPVLQNDLLVGIVTDRDLRYATSVLHPAPFSEEVEVSHVMARSVITTTPLDPVEEAARLMRRHKIGCLPVMEGPKLVGMVTGTDLLDAIIRLTGLQKPTGRIAVQLADTPGQLARVAALVDAQDVNIHSVLTYPKANKQTLVILRVDTLNTRALADALRLGGLNVTWPPED